ncbi:MAG: glutamine--fructose-6-phosphate transaminase (isomerizing) [Bavariicoccus seileri]|uniref:glutamine--fructose-6-phosphate transaminase (isomerizing) n=1 Tax=Bavariicoccus seileri TaxID=549685 RepID=UPI003F96AE36
MCGIVGSIGISAPQSYLLKGLHRLEYRGYDSAGIALLNGNGELKLAKTAGKVSDLEPLIDQEFDASIGIGHTRWATHGSATTENAHPHQSASGRFVIVHNGVIDNYLELADTYLKGVTFRSATDTEVIVQLVELFAQTSDTVEDALLKVLNLLDGSYALALIDITEPDKLYAAKQKSPMLIGVAEDGFIVCSDALAGVQRTNEFIEIHDGELVALTSNDVTISDLEGNTVERESFKVDLTDDTLDKGIYPFYMLKEIEEQPIALRRISEVYSHEEAISNELLEAVKEADRIYIVACGTSYNSGFVSKSWFERIAQKPAEIHIASEFAYDMPLLSQKPFFIFISQSGETADSRHALLRVNQLGYQSLTITNVKNSTLSREATFTLLLHAGPEVAVASTKAYIAQLAVLGYLIHTLAGSVDTFSHELRQVEVAVERLIAQQEDFETIAEDDLLDTPNAFYIGRGLDHLVSMENALKLKEISYIQTEAFPAGELKHGTIALIEEGTPVIALMTQPNVAAQTRSNLEEVKARGAKAITIVSGDLKTASDTIILDEVPVYLRPFLTVVVGQLLAYYTALHKGYNVDQPRNLAKSVTVE